MEVKKYLKIVFLRGWRYGLAGKGLGLLHEDLSLNAWQSGKSQPWWCRSVIPALEGRRRRVLEVWLPPNLVELMGIRHQSLASTCAHVLRSPT